MNLRRHKDIEKHQKESKWATVVQPITLLVKTQSGNNGEGPWSVVGKSPPVTNNKPGSAKDVCLMTESPFRILKMAAKGDLDDLERLCKGDRGRVGIKDKKGWTAAHHAAAHNQPAAITFLINHGAEVNAQDGEGRTPLHVAVEREALLAMDTLMDCGANAEVTDTNGDAPLHLAMTNNKIKSVERLVGYPTVDLYQTDQRGRTPLHLAAMNDYAECAKLLSEAHRFTKCPNQPCSNGYHPIHIAARNASVGVLEALLQYAEKKGCVRRDMITIPDLEGNVPLHLAVHSGEIKAVELCLKNGAVISTQQDDRSTPVHLACSQGSVNIVKLMFTVQPQEKVKALLTQDAQGMTPLHCAAMFDHPQLVAHLIKEGAPVDMVDREHRSPLLLAAAQGGWRSVEVLLSHGADPGIRDTSEKNLLHLVIMSGGSLSDLLQIRLNSTKTWSQSSLCVMMNEQDKLGWSPLHYASRLGQVTSLSSLLSLGASVKTKDYRNENPLHFAAKYGRYNTVRHLVESSCGCYILNEWNDEGKTALHIASEEGHTRVVQLLISKGALLHRDHQGRTPLHLAAAGGYTCTITAILAVHTHTLDQTDKDGNTPLHVAVVANKPEVITQLLSLNCKLLENNYYYSPIDIALHYKLFEASLALVTHPRGPEEVLGTSSKQNGCVCMALIRIVPRVFEAVLDQAITRAKVKETCKDFFVRYSFYPLQLNEHQLEAERVKKKDVKFSPLPLYACNAMVECLRVDLLMHPLTQKFLEMKWKAYGRYIHLSILFVYLVYLSFITYFTVGVLGRSVRTQHTINNLNSTTPLMNEGDKAYGNFTNSEIHGEEKVEFTYQVENLTSWMYLSSTFILVFAVLSMMKEVFQIYQHRMKYLMEAMNLVEWIMYMTSVCMVLPVFMGTGWSNHQLGSAAVAVFIAWFSLLLYLQWFDRIGIYIVMFLEILNTLLKVLAIFSVLIVAFGLAFHILMSQGSHLSFSNVAMSMMHTFSMMLGEIDFLALYVYPFYGESIRSDLLLFPYTTFILLIVFMILMPILLMNLLIGLAVGDIESVRKNAQLKQIAMQVELHTELENKLPKMLIKRVNRTEVVLYPNSHMCSTRLSRILSAFNFTGPMNSMQCNELEGPDPRGSEEEYVWEAMEAQGHRLKEVSTVLDQQTKLLRLIMQKMEIRNEAEEFDEGVSVEGVARQNSASSLTRRYNHAATPRKLGTPHSHY
ncbi:hypothetical protein Pmani_031988 [Petrolisthes manimaculis]|uniref:Ion transport domain-containing protein n=1 Tax=Petrolisthes manimaculis TaxID=1843537 RepID=A0AAE1NUN8_9EUCA|nr:hypothetical protein Pmani_031988 [Petrolisthes manimaculis]